MKKLAILFVSMALLFACSPQEQPSRDNDKDHPGNNNNSDDPNTPAGSDDPSVSPGVPTGVDPSTLPDEAWFSTNFWDRTDAQKMGFRGPVKSFTQEQYGSFNINGDFNIRYPEWEKYEFNEKGNLTKMISYSGEKESAEMISYYTFEYNSKGQLTDMKYFDCSSGDVSSPTSTYHYEYGNPGKRVAYFGDEWEINGMTYSIGYSYWFIPSLVNDLSLVEEDRWAAEDAYYKTLVRRTYEFEGDNKLIARVENISWTADDPDNKSTDTMGPYEVTYSGGYPVSNKGNSVTATWYDNGMMASYTEVYTFPAQTLVTTWYDNPYMVCPKSYTGGPSGPFGAIFWDYTYSDAWETTGRKSSFWTKEQVPEKDGITFNYKTVDGVEYVINTDTWTDYKWDEHGNWISRVATIEPAAQPSEPSASQYRRTIEYY